MFSPADHNDRPNFVNCCAVEVLSELVRKKAPNFVPHGNKID